MTLAGTVWIVSLFFLVLTCTGRVSRIGVMDITVTSLDPDEIPKDPVGNFDIYTTNFRITNPTNSTFENVNVEISVMPTSAYCHGRTKTFSIPRLFPLMKKKVEISIAEFSGLDCQYNYTYRVFTGTG
ncbi:MAG: hypothetical protein WC294_05575 [Methanoregula sp.]|jgi:hypothetical protein